MALYVFYRKLRNIYFIDMYSVSLSSSTRARTVSMMSIISVFLSARVGIVFVDVIKQLVVLVEEGTYISVCFAVFNIAAVTVVTLLLLLLALFLASLVVWLL